MQKLYRIRWREADIKELRTAVRLYNRKRNSLIRQVPELEDFLPKKRTVQEIKAEIGTRNDFRNMVKSLRRFLDKGAETPVVTKSGVKTTKYQIKEGQIQKRRINIKRAKERKNAKVSTKAGTMGSIKANELRPKKFNPNTIRPEDWDEFTDNMERLSMQKYDMDRMLRYKDNYYKALEGQLGKEWADKIISLLDGVSAESIYDAYYLDADMQIDYIYSLADADFRAHGIILTWKLKLGLPLSDEEKTWIDEEQFSGMYDD